MARETLYISIRTRRERRKRLVIDAAIVAAFISAIYAIAILYAMAAIAPVYHVAAIETADGRTYHAAMASESACIAFTREIGASVASANCYSETK